MKNVFILVAIVAVAGFSSCKKDNTCECTLKSDLGTELGEGMSIPDQTKTVETEKECKELNGTTEVAGITYTMTCKEK